MKVKVFISKVVECEIDDKFRQLAVPIEELKGNDIPKLLKECVEAIKKTTGLPWYVEDVYQAKLTTGVIDAVYSAENDELMVEA